MLAARPCASARDVRHIVLTHLDFDHAGGLDDFPEATVHMLIDEGEDAARQRSWLDRQRYRPQQWSSYSRWRGYEPGGEPWFGFASVRDLVGLDNDILLVPLEVRVICSHDPRELEATTGRPLDARAPAHAVGETARSAWPGG